MGKSHNMSGGLKHEINVIIGDLAIGMTLSGVMSKIMPETIHAVATIVTGLFTTAGIFFLNRILKKYFPEKK